MGRLFLHSRSQQKTRTTYQVITKLGYPVFFHWSIQVFLLGLLIFSAYKHLVPLAATAIFLLILAIMSRFLSLYTLRHLSANVNISHERTFPDEETELKFEISNNGLPIPWLEIEIELPYQLVTGSNSLSPYTRKRLRWVTTISRGQTIIWKDTVRARHRGDYQLGPIRFRSGDMFGLFPKELVLPIFHNLLVYPRIFPLNKVNFPLKALVGEKVGTKNLYEDTSRVMGSRDYRYNDPLNHIHWKASAARGALQSRQYESSTNLNLLVVLDMFSYPEDDEAFERAVSIAASLCYEADRQGFATGLITNRESEAQISTGSGRAHLIRILEVLARITTSSRISLIEQIDRFRTIIPVGATMVVVTRITTPALDNLARQFERNGQSLLWVNTEQSIDNQPGLVSLNGRACS